MLVHRDCYLLWVHSLLDSVAAMANYALQRTTRFSNRRRDELDSMRWGGSVCHWDGVEAIVFFRRLTYWNRLNGESVPKRACFGASSAFYLAGAVFRLDPRVI